MDAIFLITLSVPGIRNCCNYRAGMKKAALQYMIRYRTTHP